MRCTGSRGLKTSISFSRSNREPARPRPNSPTLPLTPGDTSHLERTPPTFQNTQPRPPQKELTNIPLRKPPEHTETEWCRGHQREPARFAPLRHSPGDGHFSVFPFKFPSPSSWLTTPVKPSPPSPFMAFTTASSRYRLAPMRAFSPSSCRLWDFPIRMLHSSRLARGGVRSDKHLVSHRAWPPYSASEAPTLSIRIPDPADTQFRYTALQEVSDEKSTQCVFCAIEGFAAHGVVLDDDRRTLGPRPSVTRLVGPPPPLRFCHGLDRTSPAATGSPKDVIAHLFDLSIPHRQTLSLSLLLGLLHMLMTRINRHRLARIDVNF
ncbi:hypothetical protein CH063_07122 [Colletotrichum higginsianum]|uniref:Uncharacterized protein n=1 Tax=Colletotrichum higginsianum (strain IMI 349063) TaxID=759273 RepID=H1V507_COLHI|nr:hypothetical protein CH063_07122 [Colletotrichum higginsianum]